MKKYLLFIVPILLLVSCGKYNNDIQQRYTGAWSSFLNTNDSIRSLINAGYVDVRYQSGDISHSLPMQLADSQYKVQLSWPQIFQSAKVRHELTGFVLSILLFLVGVAVLFFILYKKGTDGYVFLLGPAICIVAFVCAGSSIEWSATYETMITKKDYTDTMAANGNLGPFWDKISTK